ncbi:hypothetical protein VUR80DRAFT_7254 [Thermomyces stellatus]
MEAFIRVAPWTTLSNADAQRPSSPASTRPSVGHFRSLSSVPAKSTSPSRPPIRAARSPSASQLPDFSFPVSIASSPSARPTSPPPANDDDDLSTLPDPRTRAMSHSVNGDGAAADAGDQQDEVTALSTKLIRAINHQTTLDNALSEARRDLESARARIRQLESVAESQREMLAGDVWVRRKTVEGEKKALSGKVAEEKRKREAVEKEKRRIELELENLTTALFEEANKMVVSVKEEALEKQEALERKNELLRAQVADTEGLLQSQQEQLAELKAVMEQMTIDRDDQTNLTTPSSPGGSKSDGPAHERTSSEGQLPVSPSEPVSPAYPTSFSHLIQPVLRTDTAAFEDFKSLARASKNRPGTRTSSSSLSGINVANLGFGGSSNTNSHSSTPSTSSLPSGLASATSSPQGHSSPPPAGPLKDTKFFKRVLVEDIEPTLRLDAAPGLSWLARRSVLNAITEGSLVVEPAPSSPIIPQAPHPQHYPCALCGESKKDEQHLRTHRFRTSESESAQRYPLCPYCLSRVRSTCELLGFLRIVKDGHWRVGEGEEEEERSGWEESVRLREQMFWARIGGGVIPAGMSVEQPEGSGEAERGGKEDDNKEGKDEEEKGSANEDEEKEKAKDGESRQDENVTASPSPKPRSPQIRVQSPSEGRNPSSFVPMFGTSMIGL